MKKRDSLNHKTDAQMPIVATCNSAFCIDMFFSVPRLSKLSITAVSKVHITKSIVYCRLPF